MKYLKYCIGIVLLFTLYACKDKENELLENKVYFETSQQRFKVEDNINEQEKPLLLDLEEIKNERSST